MNEEEILEEIENNILNDPFITFSQDSSFEDVQIKATAIEELVKRYKKQQKEIEKRLKEIDGLYKMMSAKDDEIETLKESQLVMYGQKGEIVGVLKYTDDVIRKDKIKEKIEEITSYAYTSAEERDCQDYAIQVLKDLLGETND